MSFFSRNPEKNYEWAQRFLAEHAPDYHFRWDIYFGLLKEELSKSRFWLDAGAGENRNIGQYDSLEFKVGADTRAPLVNRRNFVRANLEALPFKGQSFDLISSHFVLEHLHNPVKVWEEWRRILKPGGKALVLTPNALNYVSFFGRLLPYRLKRYLLIRFYGVSPKDIFRTYHRFNRSGRFKKLPGFELETLIMSEEMHLHFRPLFYLSYFMHILTRLGPLGNFRSTITAVLKKTCPEQSRRNV